MARFKLDQLHQLESAAANAPQPSPLLGDGIDLSEEQQDAIDLIQRTKKPVVLLTGQAGSGKSTVINHLKARAWCTMCATTGKAAMHIDGTTVDSTFCINRRDWKVWSTKYQDFVMRKISDIVVIDEASMMGRKMADLVFDAANAFKKKLILVGDWGQARPVKDDWILKSPIMDDFEFIKLNECHRQGQGDYLTALNKVRIGVADDQVNEVFSARECAKPPEDDSWIRMYGTNQKTRAYNETRLWKHVADSGQGAFQLFSAFFDARDADKQKSKPRNEAFRMNAIESSRLCHGSPFAVGCRVVCTANETDTRSFVNGDTGTITEVLCEDGRSLAEALADYEKHETPFRVFRITVLLDRTKAPVVVGKMKRETKDATGSVVQHVVTGFPLQLGYALTIHKTQGMTVPRAWVDLESLMRFPSDESRHGLAYVALSRTRTIDGLLVNRWVPESVYCDPAIKTLL